MGRLKKKTAPAALSPTDIRMVVPASASAMDAVRNLFVEYAGTLNVDL